MGLTSWITGNDDPSDAYKNVGPAPTVDSQKYTPGTLRAKTYGAAQTGPNALAGASGSAAAQQAQRGALNRLEQQARGTMTDGDKATMFRTQQALGQQARGAQGAIMNNAAARGAANSGSTLAAQLSAAQGAQEAGANAGAALQEQIGQRALQATQAAGGLASNINQQAFQQQAVRSQAQNALNAANAAAANRASEFNAGAENDAQRLNIQNDIQAKQFLAALLQQKYDNELREAAARAGIALDESRLDMGTLQAIAGAAGSASGGFLKKAEGGTVPGQAAAPGDSYANDTVPALLSPGEIVIPRSAVGHPAKMIAFLEKETGMDFGSR